MELVRVEDAPAYDAPGHFNMSMQRLQGMEASQAEFAWMGLSHIAPGGHTDLKASNAEKLYVVLQGEVEFADGDEIVTAGERESVHFPRGASRQLRNRSATEEAVVLLVMERV